MKKSQVLLLYFYWHRKIEIMKKKCLKEKLVHEKGLLSISRPKTQKLIFDPCYWKNWGRRLFYYNIWNFQHFIFQKKPFLKAKSNLCWSSDSGMLIIGLWFVVSITVVSENEKGVRVLFGKKNRQAKTFFHTNFFQNPENFWPVP